MKHITERQLAAAESNWERRLFDAYYDNQCESLCLEQAGENGIDIEVEDVECNCKEIREGDFVEPDEFSYFDDIQDY